MKSLKELYKIGRGPSSSHTMGPQKAASVFAARHPEAASFEVTLFGSLAATGKGHLTDVAVLDVLTPVAPAQIVWHPEIFLPFHPNGMKFVSRDAAGAETDAWTVYSVGGGSISEGERDGLSGEGPDIYGLNSITEIVSWCQEHGSSYWEYVEQCEGPDIWDYLKVVWDAMKASVEAGLDTEGALPGPLNLARKAATYHIKASGYKPNLQSRGLVFSYALAVSEQNAAVLPAPSSAASVFLQCFMLIRLSYKYLKWIFHSYYSIECGKTQACI